MSPLHPAFAACDRVSVLGIRGFGRHGVYDYERRDGQTFVVDVILGLDAGRAAATDELSETVDYGAVAAAVHSILTGPSVQLLETLAQRIADAVLEHRVIERVEVTVHKPEAKLSVSFADVSVTLFRERRS